MEEAKTKTENLAEHVTQYVETYLKLATVTGAAKASGLASASIIGILISLFTMFILFFLGIGAAVWLGEILANPKAGYFIVSGIYILLTIFILALREKVIVPFIRNYIIKKIYDED